MRPIVLACLAALAAWAVPAAAQRDSTARRDSAPEARVLPREVAREVTEVFNAPSTLRVSGALDVEAGRTIEGDVAVLNGPLSVAGHITGRLVAINADVALLSGARVDGDVVVVGGQLTGRDSASLGGEARVYGEPLYFRQEGERITPEGEEGADPFWRRWRERREPSGPYATSFSIVTARTYNRVEGLPVQLGPRVRVETPAGRLRVDAYGIVRTADDAKFDTGNIGHTAHAELAVGNGRSVGLGGRLYDIVDGVEAWQLPEEEVGLAAFFLRRDYRDYFDRHGAAGYVTVAASRSADLTLGLADERWGPRRARPVWTLFRGDDGWRGNPVADAGRFHLATAMLRYDTRNDESDPWTGWYATAEYEHGRGTVDAFGATSPGVRDTADRALSYGRVFVDVRRYNRLTPHTQLDFRAVLGGWAGGDELPLQRRLSATGPGVLPGFDFRRSKGEDDSFTCSPVGSPADLQPGGRPAQCERVALVQMEYRGDVRLDLVNWWDDDERDVRRGLSGALEYVLFADAGRGWLLGAAPAGSGADDLYYANGSFPSLRTFNADAGGGLSLHGIGLYVAKPLSRFDEPANFFVRVRRRF